jgi:hypothetical protein
MSLLGQGAVAIWNDVAPEGSAEFYAWHNHEHMPERVGIPGFLRGRRWRAMSGAAEYFTLYEAESTAVLAGPYYLERLNNPTPATRHVIPSYFGNMVRGVCHVRFSAGVGIGGAVATLRLGSTPGHEAELERRIAEGLSAIAAMPMVTGAHLCVVDRDASMIATTERKSHGASVPDWLVMIEAAAPDHANEACEAVLAADLRKSGARDEMQRGLYRLEICLTKR